MSENDLTRWYSAFKAKDVRFDGRFFVGITSTGIYCRPICRAKLPKAENCSYYLTAAEAEQAGFRPCLLCRPELAPGTSIADATASLVRRAVCLLEENAGNGLSLPELARRLGCTDRHLRRVFQREYNVSPVQYKQTARFLLAKNLLTDTDLSVLDVAMASGFGSLRQFNAQFKKHYRLSPTGLRRQTIKERKQTDEITLTLGYRPPYPWSQMLDFLASRAISGVELVKNGQYLRTVHLISGDNKPASGWINVSHHQNVLKVTMSTSLLPVLTRILARIRHMFDLYCDPYAVYDVLGNMNNFRSGLFVLGTRLPGCFDSFELVVRAVLGQQVTIKAANTLATRLVKAYGRSVRTEIEGLTHSFPNPGDIIALQDCDMNGKSDENISNFLGPLGITSARSKTILALARSFVKGDIAFDLCAQPDAEMKKLIEIPGVGSWTAKYIAMRTMGWTDAFLETDVGIKRALSPMSHKEMMVMAEAWQPWRSYATISLWNYLSNQE